MEYIYTYMRYPKYTTPIPYDYYDLRYDNELLIYDTHIPSDRIYDLDTM